MGYYELHMHEGGVPRTVKKKTQRNWKCIFQLSKPIAS